MTSRKENLDGYSSPYCLTNDELSTEEMSILGGVPVFILSDTMPMEFSCSVSPYEDSSPILPPSMTCLPMKSRPVRKVPAVRITA